METIFDISTRISSPLALGGFFAAVVFFIFRQIVARNIFPRLTQAVGGEILKLIIDRLFILALVAMVLGFLAIFLARFAPEPPRLHGSLTGRWCGPFDTLDRTEMIDLVQSGAALSGTSSFVDRSGKVQGARSTVEGTVSSEGRITLTITRIPEEGAARYTFVGSVEPASGSMQVQIGGTGAATFYSRPCVGLDAKAR